MTSSQAGATTTDNVVVVDNNGSFDPELARAYSSMSSREFKDKWYLESAIKKDPSPEEDSYSSEEDDRHFIEVWSSVSPRLYIISSINNEGDNSTGHLSRNSTSEHWTHLDDSSDAAMRSSNTPETVSENVASDTVLRSSTTPEAGNENAASDTATISSATPEPVNENDASASSSSPKKNPPVRRLRPRRENQVKPYTWELALHKAKIAGIEELLSADARLRREEEKHSLEDQYEEENDHQDDDDDDDVDLMDTEDDDDDESDERIVRRGLQHMRLSEKKRHTASPSLSTSSPSLASTPPLSDIRSSGHVSLWPSHTTNTSAPTVSRVYGSKKKKHRMTKPMKSKVQSSRRRAPRIMEDDEDEDNNMDNDDIQQPEPEDEDVFAFPQHPIDSPFPNTPRQSGNDHDVDDIFDFPIDDDPVDDDPVDDPTPTTPRPRTTHQTAMDELKRRRQGRQRTTTNDDEFVVEDTEEFKPKKRKRFNTNELPSTHGVLPRSFGIVAKRLEERPKPVAQMDSLDDEEDNDARSTSSASSSSSADESPMYDPTLKQQLLPEYFESSPQPHSTFHSSPRQPSHSSSPRQPSHSSSRTRRTSNNHSSNNTIRYSSSKMPRPSNSTAQGSSNHLQQPSKKRRRRQRNKLDGIYIHPRLDDDYLPSLPKFGRGDPSRSHIPYLPSDDDMDDMELDTNTNSRSSAQLTSTASNSTPSASNQPFQPAFQPSPALSSPPPPPTPIQDPFEEFVKSHPAFTYDFNTTPSQYEGSLSGTRYIGRGFLANLFEQEQPLAMPATQVFGEELPMMDSSSSSDDDMAPAWMDYASLQRLLFKCFHHLANYIERDIGGREQEIELRKFTCIYHFLSLSIMVQGRSLPGYFEKEIECMVQRVLTLNGKRTPSKWVILMLVYYMDWKRRLHPSLNDSRAQDVLLEHLYRLGPDQVHIQVNEANITAVNIVSVEAWITLLKFEAHHGQLWHTLWTWIEEDESLPVWDKVERAWHWLFVIRVMRGFDIRGKLSKPNFQDQSAWPGVPQLVSLSRGLAEKWGTRYDHYADCLRKRWRSLNAPS